jgi:hypothetical protein
MRGIPKPLPSEDLRRLLGPAASEDKVLERAQGTETHTPLIGIDPATTFKEDFLKVCLPGFIKVVCKPV